MSQESCEAQYVDCYFDSIDRSWTPMMSGFLLSRAVRKGRDEEYTYYNAARPILPGCLANIVGRVCLAQW